MPRQAPALEVVVLSGRSGSGKTTALHALEDAGFFCVDNLPTPLVSTFLRLADENPSVRRVALAMDVRERPFQGDVARVFEEMGGKGWKVSVLYLDSANDALMNRFKATRRPHPLIAQGAATTLAEAIALEGEWLEPFRLRATENIDTTAITVHELRRQVQAHYGGAEAPRTVLQLVSFGFRHGLPPEADFIFDARFLDHPYFVPALRDRTGLDPEVASFVMGQPAAQRFRDLIVSMLAEVLPKMEAEGRLVLTVAVGCTGGHHRSVALVEALATVLGDASGERRELKRQHRDLTR